MTNDAPVDILGLVMLAFDGRALPPAIEERLRAAPAAGVSLFRALNVETPAQVLRLTESLQATNAAARPGDPPLLIAADQEGGQLIGLGDATTPFAGAMALGAAGDPDLAERVGRAVGTEMAAMGVNVAYAPSCDLASNPASAAIGIRSFGDDPAAVARLVAAYVRGLRSAGVAATAKHFPGLGDVALDSHHGLPSIPHGRDRLASTELVPFRAAIEAGTDLAMSAHIALPAIAGEATPATLSRTVMTGILRGELGFDGVSITDALDMRALGEAGGGPPQAVAAIRAGVDLLLTTADERTRRAIEEGLVAALGSGALDPNEVAGSLARVLRLRWRLVGNDRPPLDAVGSAAHRALATELAERSITLVRDEARLLPLRLPPGARIAAIMPRPVDLTPADTSSTVPPLLAEALRRHHRDLESFVTGHPPSDAEIAAIRDRVAEFDLAVIGTIAAFSDPRQVALVRAVMSTRVPVVVAALRTPFDLAAFPEAVTYLCSFGILRPTLEALADVLWGRLDAVGRLPAAIPGLHGTGDRLER